MKEAPHPTLRLIRTKIGEFELSKINPVNILFLKGILINDAML